MKKLKPRHAGKKPGPGQVPKPWLEIESDLVVLRERLVGLRNWLCLTIVPAVGPPDFSLETKAKESERELREGEERLKKLETLLARPFQLSQDERSCWFYERWLTFGEKAFKAVKVLYEAYQAGQGAGNSLSKWIKKTGAAQPPKREDSVRPLPAYKRKDQTPSDHDL